MIKYDIINDNNQDKGSLLKSNNTKMLNLMPKTFFVIESDVKNTTANVTILIKNNLTNTESIKLNKTIKNILLNKTITKTTSTIKNLNLTKQIVTTELPNTITTININNNNTINNKESSYLFQSDD